MSSVRTPVRWEIVSGEPATRGAITVTPRWRRLMVRLPFAVYEWQRPADVLVAQGERTTRIRIHDVTRILQVGLPLLGLAIRLAIMAISTNRRVRNEIDAR